MARDYTPAERYAIENKLNSLGVYDDAIHTTLILEKESSLHQYIVDNDHEQDKAILFYPEASESRKVYLDNVFRCNQLYQLCVKELHLSKNKVYYTPKGYIYHAMNEDKTWVGTAEYLPDDAHPSKSRSVLAIEDFYKEQPCNLTLKDWEAEKALERYLLHRMFNKKNLLVLYSDKDPELIYGTLGSTFLKTIIKHAKIIKVSA